MSKVNLAPFIKSRRQNIGLTQKELAEKLYVTVVTVSRWETGQREPMWNDFVRLCEVLGMNINDFIGKEVE